MSPAVRCTRSGTTGPGTPPPTSHGHPAVAESSASPRFYGIAETTLVGLRAKTSLASLFLPFPKHDDCMFIRRHLLIEDLELLYTARGHSYTIDPIGTNVSRIKTGVLDDSGTDLRS